MTPIGTWFTIATPMSFFLILGKRLMLLTASYLVRGVLLSSSVS